MQLQCGYCNWSQLNKNLTSWITGKQQYIPTSWLWANQQFLKCFFSQMLLYSKLLHRTPRRHTCLTQAVILSSFSNVFATIVNNMTNVT